MSLPFGAWLAMMLRARARFWLAPLLFDASASAARNSPTASATRVDQRETTFVVRRCTGRSQPQVRDRFIATCTTTIAIQGYSQVIRGTD